MGDVQPPGGAGGVGALRVHARSSGCGAGALRVRPSRPTRPVPRSFRGGARVPSAHRGFRRLRRGRQGAQLRGPPSPPDPGSSREPTGPPPAAPPEEPEPEIEEAFDRLVEEGRDRLRRPFLPLLSTGLLGGIDIGTGVLAYLLVLHETDDHLLAGLAFSIGFVALLLARSELFTENFLVPVTAVVARQGTVVALLRLWGLTLVANLAGGWVVAWLVVAGLPQLRPTAVEAGGHYATMPIGWRSFALAVLAGLVITLMTRMQHGTESVGVRVVPAVLFGALLAGGQLFHSVLDSLLVFAAIHAGADSGYLDWLPRLGWSALGNLTGGLVLVTAVRLLRVPHRVAEAQQG
ncbi:formate/nitrite transporter family protein [Kineococcus terrestris]|uniref:formate/nitrite transporter family protein n=1 Tax=Kineococcus terrestris TaxID=2044856 RepID=UPI0034DB2747